MDSEHSALSSSFTTASRGAASRWTALAQAIVTRVRTGISFQAFFMAAPSSVRSIGWDYEAGEAPFPQQARARRVPRRSAWILIQSQIRVKGRVACHTGATG